MELIKMFKSVLFDAVSDNYKTGENENILHSGYVTLKEMGQLIEKRHNEMIDEEENAPPEEQAKIRESRLQYRCEQLENIWSKWYSMSEKERNFEKKLNNERENEVIRQERMNKLQNSYTHIWGKYGYTQTIWSIKYNRELSNNYDDRVFIVMKQLRSANTFDQIYIGVNDLENLMNNLLSMKMTETLDYKNNIKLSIVNTPKKLEENEPEIIEISQERFGKPHRIYIKLDKIDQTVNNLIELGNIIKNMNKDTEADYADPFILEKHIYEEAKKIKCVLICLENPATYENILDDGINVYSNSLKTNLIGYDE